MELQVKVTELLLTLLEGNSDTTIPTTMISSLNFSTLLYHSQYLQRMADRKPRAYDIVQQRKFDLARNTFRLIIMLGEVESSKVPDGKKSELDLAVNTVNSSARTTIGRIEIVTAEKSLQRLYFPIPPSCLKVRIEDCVGHFF